MQIIRMCLALRRIWDMPVFMGMNFHFKNSGSSESVDAKIPGRGIYGYR